MVNEIRKERCYKLNESSIKSIPEARSEEFPVRLLFKEELFVLAYLLTSHT